MSNITIDGKEYDLDNFSDEAKAQLASIQYVDNKINEAKQDLIVLQTARNAYITQLKSSLAED